MVLFCFFCVTLQRGTATKKKRNSPEAQRNKKTKADGVCHRKKEQDPRLAILPQQNADSTCAASRKKCLFGGGNGASPQAGTQREPPQKWHFLRAKPTARRLWRGKSAPQGTLRRRCGAGGLFAVANSPPC